MRGVSLTLRTWLRYLVPLTLLSVIALLPIAYTAYKAGKPVDVNAARLQVRVAWALASCAIACQLLLVAAAAPMVRGIAAGAPLSQLRALVAGLRGMLRAFVPWLLALAAVLLGGLALVVPGALLLVLVSPTGASDRLGARPPEAVLDSVNVVRERFVRTALIVVGIVLVALAITFVLQSIYIPAITRKMAASKLVPVRTFVRAVAIALVAISPLAACALAAVYSHAKRR